MKALIAIFTFSLISGICYSQSTVTDIDGNNYKTINIGDQVWMAENLKVTKYRNGESIPMIKGELIWKNYTAGAFCYYQNNPDIGEIYGALYNWYAVNDSKGLCPTGWHVPSNDEWENLALNVSPTIESFHGDEWFIDLEYYYNIKIRKILYRAQDTSYVMTMEQMYEFLKNHRYDTLFSRDTYRKDIVALKMKSQNGWPKGENGTNSSGFSGLPGGERNGTGKFDKSRSESSYWATRYSNNQDAYFDAHNNFWDLDSWLRHESNDYLPSYSVYGRSVRCIKD